MKEEIVAGRSDEHCPHRQIREPTDRPMLQRISRANI